MTLQRSWMSDRRILESGLDRQIQSRRCVDRVRKMVRLASDGSFDLDMSYFECLCSPERSFSRKFVDVFGEPRKPEAPFNPPGGHSRYTRTLRRVSRRSLRRGCSVSRVKRIDRRASGTCAGRRCRAQQRGEHALRDACIRYERLDDEDPLLDRVVDTCPAAK